MIDKIINTTELLDCKLNGMLMAHIPIGREVEGEKWYYASHLSRYYLLYALDQYVRFLFDHKRSQYACAIKRILKYLQGPQEMELISGPTGELALDAGFYGKCVVKDPTHPSTVKSQNEYIFIM